MKAEVGFEPTNNGFAIRPLGPLGYSAKGGVWSRESSIQSNERRNFLHCHTLARP